ncbi:MAG: glycosyltransferase [Desulfobacterota bacterium]|nr:glycosyltransferase [Thermodesulfobacteriota bacterium]
MSPNKTTPLVSVVIPTRNRCALVVRAVTSVLMQTHTDLECIVVDDASTDATKEAIMEIRDPRLRYIRHESNRGASASRNQGIIQAQGSYIALLDDDDTWLPEKIEKQLGVFANASENVGLVYCGFNFVAAHSDKIIATAQPTKRGYVYAEMLASCILGSPTPLIKKESLLKVGLFDETLPGCQDWDLWIRIAKCYAFDFTPDILARHYVHGNQISANLAAKITARTILLNKHVQDICHFPPILAEHLRRLGVLHMLAGNVTEARRLLKHALTIQPHHIFGFAHLMLSFFPGIYRVVLRKYCLTIVDGIAFYY